MDKYYKVALLFFCVAVSCIVGSILGFLMHFSKPYNYCNTTLNVISYAALMKSCKICFGGMEIFYCNYLQYTGIVYFKYSAYLNNSYIEITSNVTGFCSYIANDAILQAIVEYPKGGISAWYLITNPFHWVLSVPLSPYWIGISICVFVIGLLSILICITCIQNKSYKILNPIN